MCWGIENNVIERFAGAGIPKEKISFVKDTYTFNFLGAPSELVDAFRKFYGQTTCGGKNGGFKQGGRAKSIS
jgi:hypothetical protein